MLNETSDDRIPAAVFQAEISCLEKANFHTFLQKNILLLEPLTSEL